MPPNASSTAASIRLHGRHVRVTPHELRHSWTTLAINAGVAHDQIRHDGGWADARMVPYYTHGRDQALRATTHSVAAYVLSAPPDQRRYAAPICPPTNGVGEQPHQSAHSTA